MLDVGAAGGVLPRWEGLKKNISFIGVEPASRSCEDLMNAPESKEFRSYEIIQKGAWSSNATIQINFTKKTFMFYLFHCSS